MDTAAGTGITMIADVAFYRAQVVHDAVGGIGIHADCYAQTLDARFADRASNDLSFDIHL
jgi:hypothetical protein